MIAKCINNKDGYEDVLVEGQIYELKKTSITGYMDVIKPDNTIVVEYILVVLNKK